MFHLGRLLSYLQTLYHTGKAYKGTNTLACYENLKLTAVKSFITLAPDDVGIKWVHGAFLSNILNLAHNKLERLSFSVASTLV